ncbi:protein croquemort [Drosophila bipectinata]|uniref:protein croquemort n=1 Tax=Drosophila bipectinata TaxID=42026 RepID=UPI001C8AEF5D|nr:protein croquemort [Drosophila bipectinata]
MCCNCCSVRQQKIWVFSLGGLILAFGIFLATAWPFVYRPWLRSIMPLSPGSFIYKRWVTTPVPLYSSIYLFNWTNPEDLDTVGVKPNFEQLGPYVFSDFKVKEDLVWQQPEVTYYGKRTWHFLPEKSNGSLEDVVVAPHFVSLTAASYSRRFRRILRKVMNFALNREGGDSKMTHTTGEWLFDGYYESLLDFVEQLHSPLLPIYSSNFSWFYERNNSKTAEGNFTVHTGRGDLSQLGDIMLWKGENHTGFYPGECGKVNGSTGELWSPDRRWDQPTTIFLPDAARFLNLFPKENLTIDGVDVWRYESTNRTLDNGQLSPDTKCFCLENRECPRNGVLDYGPPAFNGPFYMSHPHFYLTDEMYRENTTGLRPNASEHGMHVIMEPTLGIPLDLRGQLMISVRVQRDEAIDFFQNVSYDHYAPLFTMRMHGELDEDLTKLLKLALGAPLIGQFIGIGLILLGIIIILTGVFVTKNQKWYHQHREPEESSRNAKLADK